MKALRRPLKKRNNSGVVLLVVLWMLIILSILAFSIGRKMSIDLSLTHYAVGKKKASVLAYSGFIYALNEIKNDSADSQSLGYDTLAQCGIKLKTNLLSKDIFQKVEIDGGFFEISYIYPTSSEVQEKIYGIADEERRINLNAIDLNNYKIFNRLLRALDYSEDMAEEISTHIVDWRDEDDMILGLDKSEEEEYAELEVPYHPKNKNFDSVEELLLVKGMTPEILEKIKNFVTVFPRNSGQLLINIDTAPKEVLMALTGNFAGPATNSYPEDGDNLARKIAEFRDGSDGIDGTADDQKVAFEELNLNASERNISTAIAPLVTPKSDYLRIKVRGTDKQSDISSNLEAVVSRQDLSILYWNRD